VGLTASFSHSETINAKEVRGTISLGETELELMKMAIRQLPSHTFEFLVGDDRHACQLSHIINPNSPPCNQPANAFTYNPFAIQPVSLTRVREVSSLIFAPRRSFAHAGYDTINIYLFIKY
jgi:hypothetical protein